MSDPMPSVKSQPEWAAFASIDWANQKHFWRFGCSRQSAAGSRGNWRTRRRRWRLGPRPCSISLAAAPWRPRRTAPCAHGAHDHGGALPETFRTSGAQHDSNDTAFMLDL